MSHNPPPETQKGSARERLDQNRFQADLKSQLMSKTITANSAAKVHRRNFSNDFHLAGLTGSILASKLAPQAERGLEQEQPKDEGGQDAQHRPEPAQQPKVHKLPASKAEHRRTQSNTSEQLAWYQRGPGGIDAMMNAIEAQGEFTKLGPSFGYLEHGGGQKLSLIGSGSIPTNNSLKQMIDVHGSSKMIKSKGANFKRQKKPTDNSEGNYSSGNSLLPSNSQIMTGHSLINKSNQLLTTSGIGGEKPSKGPTSHSTGHGSNTGGSNHAPTSGGSITTASSSGDMNCLTSVMCRDPAKVAKESSKREQIGGVSDHPNFSTSNLLHERVPILSKTASHKGELILQHPDKDSSKHDEPNQKGISIQHFLGAMNLACASTASHNAQQSSNIQYLKAINAMKKPRATVGGATGNKVPTIIDTRSPQSSLAGTAAKAKAYGFSGLSTKGIGTSSKSTLGAQKVTMNNTSNIGAIASAMVSAAKSKGMSSTGIQSKKLAAGMVTPTLVQSKHYRNPSSILPSSIPTLFNSPLDALLKGGITMNHRRVQSGDKMNLRGLLQKGPGKSVSKSGSKTKHANSGLANQAELLKKSFKTELKASNFLLTENMIRSQTKTYKSPNPSSIFAKGYLKKGTDSSETDRFKPTDSQQAQQSGNQDALKREGPQPDPTAIKPGHSLTAGKPPISTTTESKPGVASSAPKKIHHRKIASLPVSNINSKFFQELNLPIAYPLKGNTMTPDESRRNTPTRGRSPRTNMEATSGFHPGAKNFEFEEHEFLPQPPKSALPKLPDAHEFYGEEPNDLNSHRNYTSFVIEEDLDELPDNIEDPHYVSVSPLAKPQIPVQNIRIPESGESGQGSGISTPQVMSRGKYSHNGAGPGQNSDKPIQIESRDSKTKPNPSNVQIALPAYKSSNSPSVSSAGLGGMYSGRQIAPYAEQGSGSRGGHHPYSNTRTNSAANIPELGSASQLEDKEIVLDFCNLSQEEDQQPQKKRNAGKLHTTEESMKGNHNIQLISPASNVYPGAMAGSASRSPSPRDFKLTGPSAPNTGCKQLGNQQGGKHADHNVQLLLPTPGSERAESDYQGSDDKSRRQPHQAVRQFGVAQPHTPGKLSNQSPKLAFPHKHHPAKSTAPFNSREFRRQGSEGNVMIDEIRRRDSRPGLINQDVASPAQENRIYSEQNSYRDNFEEPEAVVAEPQFDGPPRIPPPRPNAPKQSRFHKFEEVFSDKNEVPLVLQKLLLVDKIKSFYSREKARDIQTTLDFYKIIKLIGKGNFGKVYRAVSVLTGKEVAIKKFEKADIQNDQAKQRIFQEAGNLKKLNHHNIAKLYEVFENKASIFYVMEYATEGDLLNLIESRGPLDEDSARFIAIQVVHGLKHCHSKGVLHRDIKLDNILLSDNFVVKICDFGISKLVKKGEVMTEDSGTAVYIAPEVISGKGYTGFQSDIWSLGVTLYIVLTGRIPFKPPANQSSEVLHQMIKKGEFTFPESIPLSPDVQDLIRQMLCVNSEKRITIDQIMKHPWFNRKIIDRFTTFLKDQSDEASSDHALRKLQELGFPEPSIKKAVNEQYLNHIYCCYQIYKHL